jgi:hypothetical protein
MLVRLALLIAALTLAAQPVRATAEHRYGKREYAVIKDGRAPNGRLAVAAHGAGEFGNDDFHLYLMAGSRRLAVLGNVSSDNNLDTAPDAYFAAWSPDSRYVAVSFRSERHIVTLNLYAIEGSRARLISVPDLFKDATGRAVNVKEDGDMRTFVPSLQWQGAGRFRLSDYRLFVEDDATLADRLGPLGKATKMDDGRYSIEFSAEADVTRARGDKFQAGKVSAGTFPKSE